MTSSSEITYAKKGVKCIVHNILSQTATILYWHIALMQYIREIKTFHNRVEKNIHSRPLKVEIK